MKRLKKAVCLCLAFMLVFTPSTSAFAKNHKKDKQNNKKYEWYQNGNKKLKAQKQKFKLNDKSVIKYGRYKLPINAVTKGMGAKLDYKKTGNILKIEKGDIKIEIDFKNETVYINGVQDQSANIFKQKNKNKAIVLIQYIAKKLGIKIDCKKDEIIVETPSLDYPTNIKITPIGTIVKKNTLNSTTTEMIVTAKIKAGQATGGKAELYVGNKLVATDTVIKPNDTTVSFTTSDGTPTNEELKKLIPSGGTVSVRLYNANGNYVTSNVGNPTLEVDYVAPTLTSITSATYVPATNQIYLDVTGASADGDFIDVTKISIFDSNLQKSYTLTNKASTGSTGLVKSSSSLLIQIGSLDRVGLTGFGETSMFLTIKEGALLQDKAGNTSTNMATQVLPLKIAK